MSSGVQYVPGSFPGSEGEGMKESRHSSGEGSGGWLLTEVVVTVASAAGLGWWEIVSWSGLGSTDATGVCLHWRR